MNEFDIWCPFWTNKSERPVDALAVKNINYSLTHSLTTWNQEMLAHLKIKTDKVSTIKKYETFEIYEIWKIRNLKDMKNMKFINVKNMKYEKKEIWKIWKYEK